MFLILCCADIYWPFVVGEWPPGDIWQELTPSTLHAAIDQAAAQSGIQINYTTGRPAQLSPAGPGWRTMRYDSISRYRLPGNNTNANTLNTPRLENKEHWQK